MDLIAVIAMVEAEFPGDNWLVRSDDSGRYLGNVFPKHVLASAETSNLVWAPDPATALLGAVEARRARD